MVGDPLQFRASGQVLRFGGNIFVFLLYMLLKIFFWANKISGVFTRGYEPGEHPSNIATVRH